LLLAFSSSLVSCDGKSPALVIQSQSDNDFSFPDNETLRTILTSQPLIHPPPRIESANSSNPQEEQEERKLSGFPASPDGSCPRNYVNKNNFCWGTCRSFDLPSLCCRKLFPVSYLLSLLLYLLSTVHYDYCTIVNLSCYVSTLP
jgi:hypothetical protein